MNTQELTKQFKVPLSIVELEYAKITADLKTQGLTGTDLEMEAGELVIHALRGITSKSKGELFTGMILAVDKIKDNANPNGKPSKRQLQINAYVANPEETLAAGKVALLSVNAEGATIKTSRDRKTGEVISMVVSPDMWKEYIITVGDTKLVPLDDLKAWPSGKENFGYLYNLPLHQYRTSMIIVLKTSAGYKLAELDYSSERFPGDIPMFQSVEFVAIPKEEKDGIVHLGTSKFTTFEASIEEFGKTPLELIQTFLGGIKYPINKLTDYHTQMVRDGKKWDTLVMIEAWVSDIRGLDKTPYLLVNDNTTPVDEPLLKVWLHDGIDINFGQNSKVFIIGKTSQGDKWDAETKTALKGVPGDITVWAMSIYPKYNTAPKNLKPIVSL
jgi:hypothetical protein